MNGAVKIVDLKQGTPEWLKWRSGGTGSSDAATIMGVSKWETPFGLWALLTGRAKPRPQNYAMRRGIALEPLARAQYEKETGLVVAPVCMESLTHPHRRISLDGWNESARRVVEIKVAGREDHAVALYGEIPEHYKPQLQYQLAISGGERADYVSRPFSGGDQVKVEVAPDLKYQAELLERVDAFWDLLKTDVAPEFIDLDYKRMRKATDPESVKLYHDWRAVRGIAAAALSSLGAIYGMGAA